MLLVVIILCRLLLDLLLSLPVDLTEPAVLDLLCLGGGLDVVQPIAEQVKGDGASRNRDYLFDICMPALLSRPLRTGAILVQSSLFRSALAFERNSYEV
jgi:hypothetical protein